MAFGAGKGGKQKSKGLNIELSDDGDQFDKFMPPTREQFENQYGDTILDGLCEDNDEDEDMDEQKRAEN